MRSVGFVALFLLSGCASSAEFTTDLAYCDPLSEFASSVSPGETKTVKYTRGGRWLVDHYKSCHAADGDPAGEKYCSWLIENTSTEFMEANVNYLLSCLQGHQIKGSIGNTGIEYWSGKIGFYKPNLGAKNVEVEVEYLVDYRDEDSEVEDFVSITVKAK